MVEEAREPRGLLPLTPAVLHILLALADGERHGYGIMKEVEHRTGGGVRLGPGTLYGSVKRMLADRLIEESDERPDPEMDDQRRRYYRITDFGRRVAGAEAERLAGLVETAREKKLLGGGGATSVPRGGVMPGERALRVSERVYKASLMLYPRGFRDAYGQQMAQVFRDLCRKEIGRAGVVGLIALWVRTVRDLLSTAVVERRNMTTTGGGFVVPFASSPKMVRWGGIAGVIGGVWGLASSFLLVLDSAYPRAFPAALDEPGFFAVASLSAELFTLMGIVGLYALVARSSGKLAPVGVLLACVSTVVFVASNAYLRLTPPPGPGGNPWLMSIIGVSGLIGLAGFLLLGLGVVRARGLGRWSILPLALGLINLLLPVFIFAMVLPYGASAPRAGSVGFGMLLQLPEVIQRLGWLLLGYLLWSLGGSHGNHGENEAREDAVAG